METEDEEKKDAAQVDDVKGAGGKDAVGKSGQSVGRAFGQRFFSSSQAHSQAPEMKKKRKRQDQDKTEKDKSKKKSRKERSAEEILAILAQPGPTADGHERSSSGRVSRPTRRPGDELNIVCTMVM